MTSKLVKVFALLVVLSLMAGVAQAKHHKKKGHPKPTPTTTTRIYNPRDMPDPRG
jgi:hypothetical protein